MSKEIEYIEKMICWYDDNFSQLGKERNQEHIEQLTKIKSILTEYETIDSTNPSEALNVLLDRANHDEFLGRIGKEEALKFLNENQIFVDTIKQTLLKAEQDKKKSMAWDIAMAKGWRVVADVITHKNYCDYIDYIKNYDKKLFNSEYRLTEKEFNTLNEVLG